MTAPGWYPDPLDPSQVRYWNGAQWSATTQPRWAPVGSPAVTVPAPAEPVAGATSSPWLRLVIGLVDCLVCVPLVLLVSWPICVRMWNTALFQALDVAPGPTAGPWDATLLLAITVGIWCGYGLLLTHSLGGTLGQRLCGIRVGLVGDDAARPGWGASTKRAFVRALLAGLGGQFILGGGFGIIGAGLLLTNFIVAVSAPHHRSLCDLAAGTTLVTREG